MDNLAAISVHCHSGIEYAEYPTEFVWQDQYMEVTRIEARWRTIDERCFRVLTQDGSQL